jgi:hypothetical protein
VADCPDIGVAEGLGAIYRIWLQVLDFTHDLEGYEANFGYPKNL